MKRVTITITDAAYALAKEQADEAERTVAEWLAWLAETYQPPEEIEFDD